MAIIAGWVIKIIGAIIVLFMLYFVGIGLSWRIKDAKKELNNIPKFFKAIGKFIGTYIIVTAIGLVITLILWVLTLLPSPYPMCIICIVIGFFAGCIFVTNRKN